MVKQNVPALGGLGWNSEQCVYSVCFPFAWGLLFVFC